MPIIWRIAKTRLAGSAFDGEGARLNGGRWNSVGVRVAYASESIALASLEVLVGLQESRVLASYSLVSAQIDEASVETLLPTSLPVNWRHHPPAPDTQAIGDQWVVEQRSLVLRVPSAVVEAESNYLLNPAHPDFGTIKASPPMPYAFDARLLAALRKS
ncbi:MAG: RES family NAD+ phosphorylase [Gemmatimonadales bacterium]